MASRWILSISSSSSFIFCCLSLSRICSLRISSNLYFYRLSFSIILRCLSCSSLSSSCLIIYYLFLAASSLRICYCLYRSILSCSFFNFYCLSVSILCSSLLSFSSLSLSALYLSFLAFSSSIIFLYCFSRSIRSYSKRILSSLSFYNFSCSIRSASILYL